MNDPGFDRKLLRDVSRSFYLSLRVLPRRMRLPCALGYLLARLSDTIADTVTVPVATRLQLLRDFRRSLLGSLPYHQLHESLAQTLRPHVALAGEVRLIDATESCFQSLAGMEPRLAHAVTEVVQTITTGQASDLRHFPGPADAAAPAWHALPSAAELVTYTDHVAGCVGRFWTRTGFLCFSRFSSLPPGELAELGTRFGQALQLVNILRDLPADLDAGRCYLPEEELKREGWSAAIPWREQTAPLLRVSASWEARAGEGLQDGLRYADSLRSPRVRIATALPALLGLQTIELLRREPEQRISGKVKVSRRALRQAVGKSLLAVFLGRPLQGSSSQPPPLHSGKVETS